MFKEMLILIVQKQKRTNFFHLHFFREIQFSGIVVYVTSWAILYGIVALKICVS